MVSNCLRKTRSDTLVGDQLPCEEPFDIDRLASMAITNHGEITGTEIEADVLGNAYRWAVHGHWVENVADQ